MALPPDTSGRDEDYAGDSDTAEVVASQEGYVGETVIEFDDKDDCIWGEDGGETGGLRTRLWWKGGHICTMKL